MAGIPDEAVEKIKEFLDMVEASGLSLEMAIVFGSYVTGKQASGVILILL